MPASDPQSPLILASGSPRRRELLALLGVRFRVLTADVDERMLPGEPPADLVRRLSAEKAAAVAATVQAGIVLAADTVVVLEGQVLGKPASAGEAREMLRALRGRGHAVLSGITALQASDGRSITEVAETIVEMRHYSDEELEAYVASGDPMDEAGAYAIQHAGFRPVRRIAGCYSTVVGLPLCHVYRALRELGLSEAEVPVRPCIASQASTCDYWEEVLPELKGLPGLARPAPTAGLP